MRTYRESVRAHKMSRSLFLSFVLRVLLLSFIPALQGLTIHKISPDPTYCIVGQTLFLNVSYTYGGGDVEVKWTNHNGLIYQRRLSGPRIEGYEIAYVQASLKLINFQSQNEGNYTVRIKTNGKVASASFSVIIPDGPRETKFTNVQKVQVGSNNFQVKCTATGNPEPTYTMYHNGTEITTAVNGVYTIRTVEYSDAGNYTCTARNVGTQTTSFILQVSNGGSSRPTTPVSPTPGTTQISSRADQLNSGSSHSSENKWYLYIITSLCGVIVGVAVTILIIKCRQRGTKLQENQPNTQYDMPTTQENSNAPPVYQELGVRRMTEGVQTGDNYEALRKNVRGGSEIEVEYVDVVESGYEGLSSPKGRNDEHYQPLQKV